MTLAVLTIAFLTIGAVALAVMDKALGPESGQFPCAHPLMQGALRLYAFALFNRAAVITSGLWTGSHAVVGIDVLFGAAAMATAHCVILYLLLQARLPAGVWPRLERRLRAEQRMSAQRL